MNFLKCDVTCSWTPSPLSQTVTPSRTPDPSSVTYFMDGPYTHIQPAPIHYPNPPIPTSPTSHTSLQILLPANEAEAPLKLFPIPNVNLILSRLSSKRLPLLSLLEPVITTIIIINVSLFLATSQWLSSPLVTPLLKKQIYKENLSNCSPIYTVIQ